MRIEGFTPQGKAVQREMSLGYNKAGQLIHIDGAREEAEDITTIEYYDCSRANYCRQPKIIRNALGHAIEYQQYDALGRVQQIKASNGLITRYRYHPRGWLLNETRISPKGVKRSTQYRYDNAGQLTEVHFADGIVLTMYYNAAHELVRVQDNANNQIHFAYDAKGNQIAQTLVNAKGETELSTQQSYDIRNRVQRVQQNASITHTLYNAAGQLKQLIDPNQNPATEYEYDALGRLTKSIDSLKGDSQLAYNVADQVIGVYTPNGAKTEYQYDDLGNQRMESSPDRGIRLYEYDSAGNLTSAVDANNRPIDYQYDALNRLVKVQYHTHSIPEIATFEYDTCGIGYLCSVRKPQSEIQYQYNAWGNVTTQTNIIAKQPYTVQYHYDKVGRLQGMTYPDNSKIHYKRDMLGRIVQVIRNGDTLLRHRQYRADGQYTQQTLGNGLLEQRSYTSQGLLSTQRVTPRLKSATAKPLYEQYHRYDKNQNLTQKGQIGYEYDALNRLIADNSNQYQYDANSNRLSKRAAKGKTAQTLAYYSHSNLLYSLNQHVIETDKIGNQLNGNNGQRYEYNAQNRLSSVLQYQNEQETVVAQYQYNAFNQRVRKQLKDHNTVYIYDLVGNLIYEHHQAKRTTTNKDKKQNQHIHYVWVAGQLLTQHQNGTTAYIINDHMNTPRQAYSSKQNLVWQWQSDGFGEQNAQGSITLNLRFPGQYYDAETQLHYNWHRYYNPQTGRYLSSDPIGLAAGINTYAYVSANPANSYDLMGLEGCGIRQDAMVRAFAEGKISREELAKSLGIDVKTLMSVLPNEVTGTLQVVAGISEAGVAALLIAIPEPTTSALGYVLLLHASDVTATGINTLRTGNVQATLTEEGITASLTEAGVKPATAREIARGVDGGISLAGGVTGSLKVVTVQSSRAGRVGVGSLGDAARGAGNFSRKLDPSDLGIKGNLVELKGAFSVQDGLATVKIDMIRGQIKNRFQVIDNLANTARANGASTLRIEGTLANERLFNVLSRRFGLTSDGATDVITIPLKK